MQQARYLEGSPLMWMLPLYLHVNQKSDDDDDDNDGSLFKKRKEKKNILFRATDLYAIFNLNQSLGSFNR